jgi:hypothetical protein
MQCLEDANAALRSEIAQLRAELSAVPRRDAIEAENARLLSEISRRTGGADAGAVSPLAADVSALQSKVREFELLVLPQIGLRQIPFSAQSPLDGIIAYLARKCGGNVHRNKVVAVTAFKPLGGFDPAEVVDLKDPTTYVSEAGPTDQWVALDFKAMTVYPTYYSLRTRTNYWAGNMQSWVIEGSMDGKDWQAMTEIRLSNEINQKNRTLSFPITRPVDCRHVRFHMPPADGNRNIILSGFELFGTLRAARSK